LFPPVLVAEPPARPNAGAGILSDRGRTESGKIRLEAEEPPGTCRPCDEARSRPGPQPDRTGARL